MRETTRIHPLAAIVGCAVIGLTITTVLTSSVLGRERTSAAVETNTRLVAVGDAIDRQVLLYAETLFGLREAFAHAPGLSNQDFHDLLDITALTRRIPGAESVSFNKSVPDAQLGAFQEGVRRRVPGFTVHPASHVGEHVVVDYLEPAVPGSPALGLDIAADPVRREALVFARDSGELSATRPLSLVQGPPGPGFLLMLAAYDESPVPVTTPARDRHFLGVLVAAFAADTMIDQTAEARRGLPVAVYDAGPTVNTPRAQPRLADWVAGKRVSEYTNYADINVGSRRWRLVTDSPVTADTAPAVATAISGAALTLLVVGLFSALYLSRRRALRLAESMTTDLQARKEELRAANESLREFIDIAAHDLRSPLVSIAGFNALLNDDQVDLTEDERVTAVTTIERQSRHMSRLIDDLLTMSSIDGSALRTRPEDVVLVDAIQDCLESTEGYSKIVEVVCEPDLVVRVDAHHLRRILDNCVHNAVKYGSPPVRIVAARAGSEVEIRVLDQGPGIPKELEPRLFGKFARADNSDTKAHKGTGLGLSIVRGLAEANGGRALYEPNTPRGACFIVRLPAAAIR